MSALLGFAWMIICVLFVFWLVGLFLHIGGGLIHLLLVLALVILVCRLVLGVPL